MQLALQPPGNLGHYPRRLQQGREEGREEAREGRGGKRQHFRPLGEKQGGGSGYQPKKKDLLPEKKQGKFKILSEGALSIDLMPTIAIYYSFFAVTICM